MSAAIFALLIPAAASSSVETSISAPVAGYSATPWSAYHLRVGGPWTVHLFHGQLKPKEKDANVARFRDGSGPQLLISTEAGGEGRNFQFCHILINYDLPWNPMKVEQRIGRLDRIGQERTLASGAYQREVPFLVPTANGYAVGRVDLVFREANGELVLVDYKTDAVAGGDCAEHASGHHAGQAETYRDGLRTRPALRFVGSCSCTAIRHRGSVRSGAFTHARDLTDGRSAGSHRQPMMLHTVSYGSRRDTDRSGRASSSSTTGSREYLARSARLSPQRSAGNACRIAARSCAAESRSNSSDWLTFPGICLLADP